MPIDYRLLASIPQSYMEGMRGAQAMREASIADRIRQMQLEDEMAKREAMTSFETKAGRPGTVAGRYEYMMGEPDRERARKEAERQNAFTGLNTSVAQMKGLDYTPTSPLVPPNQSADVYEAGSKAFIENTVKPKEPPKVTTTPMMYQEPGGKVWWGLLDEQGNVVKPRIRPASKHDIEGGGVDPEDKRTSGFRAEKSHLDALYGRRATIEKGYDPITGEAIPQTQIATAKATIQGQINKAEQYISRQYPDLWKTYNQAQPDSTGGIQGDIEGNKFIVDGQEYPVNPDGTVTIGNKTYRVE